MGLTVKRLPNLLTLVRILVIPLIVMSFYFEGKLAAWFAVGLFVFASLTDFVDGYLARLLQAQTHLGRFLDPIADKLLVVAVILMLTKFDAIGTYDVIPAIAIVCREILVSGLREYLAEINVSMPVSKLGKFKTTMQMIALLLLLLGERGTGLVMIEHVGGVALWIAAALTLVSGYAYLRAGLYHMVR